MQCRGVLVCLREQLRPCEAHQNYGPMRRRHAGHVQGLLGGLRTSLEQLHVESSSNETGLVGSNA